MAKGLVKHCFNCCGLGVSRVPLLSITGNPRLHAVEGGVCRRKTRPRSVTKGKCENRFLEQDGRWPVATMHIVLLVHPTSIVTPRSFHPSRDSIQVDVSGPGYRNGSSEIQHAYVFASWARRRFSEPRLALQHPIRVHFFLGRIARPACSSHRAPRSFAS